MRRVTGLFATSIVLFFAPTAQCAEQTSDEQTHQQLAAKRWEIASKVECPTENCELPIGQGDLPLGALVSYHKCSEDVKRSYVFRKGEDSWRLVKYEAELLETGCPALPEPPLP